VYYVVFTLCALYDARSLSVPRVFLLVLCLVACVGAGGVPATCQAHPVHRALSGLLLALPMDRLAVRNRCGVGDSAGAYALGGHYGVPMGAFVVTAGIGVLLVAAHAQGVRLHRARGGRAILGQRPALSPARYPLFPALLAGDLTVRATTPLLTAGGVL
jgi:hypothetical protein